MSVSENLKSAVAQRNIEDIRGSLWSCIVFDMNMTGSFKESLEYVLANGISESELFETDKDVGAYSTEASNENYSELGGLLRINFSKKKLDALRTMGCALYPIEVSEEKKTQGKTPPRSRALRQKVKQDDKTAQRYMRRRERSLEPESERVQRHCLERKSSESSDLGYSEQLSGRVSAMCLQVQEGNLVIKPTARDLSKKSEVLYEKEKEFSKL